MKKRVSFSFIIAIGLHIVVLVALLWWSHDVSVKRQLSRMREQNIEVSIINETPTIFKPAQKKEILSVQKAVTKHAETVKTHVIYRKVQVQAQEPLLQEPLLQEPLLQEPLLQEPLKITKQKLADQAKLFSSKKFEAGSSKIDLQDRVLSFGQAQGFSNYVLKKSKEYGGVFLSDKQQGEARVNSWYRSAPRPDQIERGNLQFLKKGDGSGAFVLVDPQTNHASKTLQGPKAAALLPNGEGRHLGEAADRWDAQSIQKYQVARELRPNLKGGYTFKADGYKASIDAQGQILFQDNMTSYTPKKTGVDYSKVGILKNTKLLKVLKAARMDKSKDFSSGSFDINDILLRLAGKDPYIASKIAFLKKTQELRMRMKGKQKRKSMEQALVAMRESLDAIESDTDRNDWQKRKAIFMLWDECLEDKKGLIARYFIETYIRAYFPEKTKKAYLKEELQALNILRKKINSDQQKVLTEFSPYQDF